MPNFRPPATRTERDTFGPIEDIFGIFRFGHRTAMDDNHNLRVDGFSGITDFLGQLDAIVERF